MKKTELIFLLFLLTNRVFAQSECPCLNFENDKIKPDKGLSINNDFHNEWKSDVKGDWSGNDKLISWTFQLAIEDKEVYEKYFKKYREIFQIDGVHAEYYNELSRMYNEKN